jgi:nitroimidazol reductase NimA-like FMN-containing flavoprotein (pyridoxamine 5'-phosphate oxidase superfamily)
MWMDAKGATVLPTPECKRLLALVAKRGEIGRLGLSTSRAPIVIPVNFTFDEGQVLARVGGGSSPRKASGQLVAFEVDDVDLEAGTAWSVLVRGLATLIELPTRTELSAAARPLVPEPGDMVLVIRPDILTGRRFEIRADTEAGV